VSFTVKISDGGMVNTINLRCEEMSEPITRPTVKQYPLPLRDPEETKLVDFGQCVRSYILKVHFRKLEKAWEFITAAKEWWALDDLYKLTTPDAVILGTIDQVEMHHDATEARVYTASFVFTEGRKR